MVWNDQQHCAKHIDGGKFIESQVGLVGGVEDHGCCKEEQDGAENDDQCQNALGDTNPDRGCAHGKTGQNTGSRNRKAGELITVGGWERGDACVSVIFEELQAEG